MGRSTAFKVTDLQDALALHGWSERQADVPVVGTKVFPDPEHTGCAILATFDMDSGHVRTVRYTQRHTLVPVTPTMRGVLEFLQLPG